MAKVKNEFRCFYCGGEIEYGSPCAVFYDDHWYCDTDCLVDDLNIETDPWVDEYEYSYTEDESNGFGIKYIRDNSYSNGRYVIFDKCPFELDDEYNEYFGVRYGDNAPSVAHLLEAFEKFKDKFKPLDEFPRTVRRKIFSASSEPYFTKVCRRWFITDYWTFVIRQLAGGQFVKPSEISVALDGHILLIICNGKRAIIMGNCEPEVEPHRFEEADYYGEGLCESAGPFEEGK